MRHLRQSTATTILVGQLTDVADGVTPKTTPTLASLVCNLFKGVTASTLTLTAVGVGDNDFVHVASGHFSLELTDDDTDTLGHLRITIDYAAEIMPVQEDFEVLPANVYDSLYSTDRLQVDVREMAAGVVDAAAIATDAIDADALKADAGAEFAAALLDADVTDHLDPDSVGRALHVARAGVENKTADRMIAGQRIVYDDDGSTPLVTKNQSSDEDGETMVETPA